ncbi:MAG: phage tail tape measure protein [Oscillospiraceae bacterium]|nr:phage tail tape measure protein [Oscillospiraceae bacterium]
MANRIAGITVEIGGDTTKLQPALKAVNSEIKSTQAQLKDVNSRLKLDPTNTTLLAQKQKLLTDAISETKEKLTTLKAAAEQANTALQNGDITQEQYDALQREIVETEEKLKSLADQAAESNAALVKIGDAGEKLQAVGDSISGVGTRLLGVTTAVVALGTAAVATTADFETAMSKVKSLISSSSTDLEGDMERLEEAARKAGETTKFSATEAAEAMSYMGLAGWSADEMIQGLDGILNLAAASEMDLATASDIVTDYLSAFGLTAADSGTLVDKMAYAMSNSNTSTAQLGEAYKNCAATATQLGYGLDETTAALMVMADAGIKGGEAGTALSSIMTRLGNNTSGCTDMLADYGIEVYDTEGNVNSLSNILSGMQGIWADLTDEQRANLAYVVAGKTAQSELMTVLGETTGSFQAYQEGLAGCSGTAENMAEIMQDNLSGQLTILKSQLQELAISFGEILMPSIKSIIGWIQNLVDKLNNMDEETRETIVKVGLLVAAIGPLLIVIGKTISTVGTAMKGFSSLGTGILKIVNHAKTGTGMIGKLITTIGSISAPVAAVVAVIGVLVAAFVTLWNTNDEFREKIITIWDGIVSKITEFVDGIKERLADLGINLGSLGDMVETLKNIWLGFCNLLAPVFEGAFSVISSVLSTVLDVILGLLDVFIGIFTGDWEQAWTGVKELFAAAWELIASIFQTAANNLSGILSALKSTVLEKLSGIKDSVKSVFSELVSGALSWGKDLIANFISGITSKIQSLKDSVSSVASTIKSYIGFSLPETGPLADADTYMPDFMELMAEGIRNNLSGVLSSVKSMAVGINDTTRGALTASDSSNFGDSLRSVAADIINAFTSAQPSAGQGRIELTVNLGGAQVAKQIYRLYNEASEVRGGALV